MLNFFIQRSTRSLFESLTYKLSFYLGGIQFNCLLYLHLEMQIKLCEILPPPPFYRRTVAIVGDLHALLGLNSGFVGIREKLIVGNRTGKAGASFPSLVSLWQEENFTLVTHPVILTLSRICINYTSTRQWSFCHLTLYNKRQTTGVNEANYSTSEISGRAETGPFLI